jgi:MFS transporter, DHA1 family, multidrug resistance protein
MLRPNTLAMTALLALMTALGPLSTDMYLPSLPAIAESLGATTSEAQLSLSVFLLGFAAGQLVYGPFADRFGRKPMLLAGLLLFTAASLACSLAPSIGLLILARFVQALGAAGPIVLARAVVRDLYDGTRASRELSRMGMIMGLVPAAAPVAGGMLHAALGWASNFWAMALVGLLGMGVVGRKLPETLARRNPAPVSPQGIARSFADVARHSGFRAYLALMALTYGGLFAWISGSSFVLQQVYGLSEIAFALAFAVGVVGYIFGTVLAQALLPRIGIERTIAVGAVMLAAAGLAMLAGVLAGPGHAAEVVLPMALYLCGVGCVMPQAMAGALMPFPDRAGAASSFAGFVQMITGSLIGALVGLALSPKSALPLPVAVAATGLASAAVFLASRRARAVRAASAT